MTSHDLAQAERLEQRIKYRVVVLMAGLILSGVTAFPIASELEIAHDHIPFQGAWGIWLDRVYTGVRETSIHFPFIAYGTDWLAFAHLCLALLFVGVVRNPVRNKWIIDFGLLCCAGIFPLAFICGEIRAIPVFWRLIDCSFGLVAGMVLYPCHRMIGQLEKINHLSHEK